MKNFIGAVILTLIVVHVYLYYRAQIVYLENERSETERIFCLYSNYCQEVVSNGGVNGYRVTRHGQPYFQNIFYDFEILKNETNVCPQVEASRLEDGG